MTIGEVQMVIDAYAKEMQLQLENKKREEYNLAYLTASFIGSIFAGKQPPSFDDVYQSESKQDVNLNVKKQNDINIAIIKERLIDFANEANKRRR